MAFAKLLINMSLLDLIALAPWGGFSQCHFFGNLEAIQVAVALAAVRPQPPCSQGQMWSRQLSDLPCFEAIEVFCFGAET